MLEDGPTSKVTQGTPAFKVLRACLVPQRYMDTFSSPRDPVPHLLNSQWGSERGRDLPEVTPLTCEADASPHLSDSRPCSFHYPRMSTNVFSTHYAGAAILRRERQSVGIRKENTQCTVIKVGWRRGEGLWKWEGRTCQGDGKT